MEKFNLTSVIWKEEGVFVSKCPELEISSAGDTPQEALENLKEAIELYLENNKIAVDREGKIAWIWNPERVKKYHSSPELAFE